MSPKIKKLAIGTLIILILFFAYKFFFVSDSVPSFSSQSATDDGGEVTLLLNQLRSIRLNTDIFEDKAFLSLVDYGVVLDPQPVGRINPFAPIGQGRFIALPEQEEAPEVDVVDEEVAQ